MNDDSRNCDLLLVKFFPTLSTYCWCDVGDCDNANKFRNIFSLEFLDNVYSVPSGTDAGCTADVQTHYFNFRCDS